MIKSCTFCLVNAIVRTPTEEFIFMSNLIHRYPSVGSVVKKMMEVNPDLSVQQVISLIRQSIQTQGEGAKEFASAEFVDEQRALELARTTLKSR